jgi:hypothetical protein
MTKLFEKHTVKMEIKTTGDYLLFLLVLLSRVAFWVTMSACGIRYLYS